jgi:hypothetical protein
MANALVLGMLTIKITSLVTALRPLPAPALTLTMTRASSIAGLIAESLATGGAR